MNTERHGFRHGAITYRVPRIFYHVDNELGYGSLEAVYESAMGMALGDAGLRIERQRRFPVRFRGRLVGDYVADVIVENLVLPELRAVKDLDPSQAAQTLNDLKSKDIGVGLLLGFGPKPQVKRFTFRNARKRATLHPPEPSSSRTSPR